MSRYLLITSRAHMWFAELVCADLVLTGNPESIFGGLLVT